MGRIVAVSAALPWTHVVNGQEMSTSIVRPAADKPIFFGPDGPENNATAMHTEQVCVFCTERYDHWTRELGLTRDAWSDCQFGENILVEGLTEDDVRVGDRLRTSRGVLLEVAGCRSNCAKLTWRMGAPPSFLRTLVAAGWIGYYLRVIETGWVSAGDGIEIEVGQSDQPTIAELTRAIHEQDKPDLAFLRAAAAARGLGAQTREVLKKRICDVEDVWRTRTNRWKGWRPFTVMGRHEEAPGISSLQLRPVDDAPIALYRAGQFLTVRLPEEADSAIRSWSISDYGGDEDGYRITVKRAGEGIGSNWAQSVEPGALVALRPPAGQFVLDRSTLRRVILVSAGIGVTPLYAMLKAHAARGADASPVIWVHSTRSSATNVFAREIDALLAASPIFQRQLHFTDPLPGDVLGRDYDRLGRITSHTISELVGEPYDLLLIGREVKVAGYNNEVFICGPHAFQEAIRDAFIAAGTVPHYIRTEAFQPPRAGGGEPGPVDSAKVRFDPAGLDCRWSADDDCSLLDLAIEHGLEPDFSCRAGQCGACVARLCEGKVRHHPEPSLQLKDGEILLCCARPMSASLRIALPEPVPA
jgi:ferredoxin-NADP reductase/MOSC domain-containing protein YiiM/ferredoxin